MEWKPQIKMNIMAFIDCAMYIYVYACSPALLHVFLIILFVRV